MKLPFSPLHYCADHGALLGQLLLPAEPHPIPHALSVQRGRRGKKPPEQLDILGLLAPEYRQWPRARQAGMLKAICRALDDARGTSAARHVHWWLAHRLALTGYVACADWQACCRDLSVEQPELGARIEHSGMYLAWREYLELQRDELADKLTRGKRNPFLSELTTPVVQQLLSLSVRDIAARIAWLFAERHELPIATTALGIAVPLVGAFQPPEPPPGVARLAGEVHALYEASDGVDRMSLARRYPAQQHVLRQLFDAGMLVESPDGYIFTGRALRQHLVALTELDVDLASVGVGKIKTILGLPRRPAEALRAYLLAMFNDPHDDCAPRRGRG